jgi:hypothetical protein
MWCPKCESEVATEVAADGQSLLCISCGGEIRKLTAPSLHPDIRRARDLLNRLSSVTAAAPPVPDEPADSVEEIEPAATAPSPTPATQPVSRQFRIDRPHPTAEVAKSHVGPAPAVTVTVHPVSSPPGARTRSDEPHAALPAPHFHVEPARPRMSPGRGESMWGQLLAYGGVAVLTVGTALVVWGYLGGPPTYAPMGWLTATAGQMLLLLGVVTFVAGGMQQTTHEVSSRVAHLNGRVIRIEQTANEILRGPHFGKAGERDSTAAQRSRDADAEQA